MRRYITKAELKKQIRSVQKRHPNATYAEALKINRKEQLAHRNPAEAKSTNKLLHRVGLGTGRGLYMETPLGLGPDGKMKFHWGRLLSYEGLGQERSGSHSDGDDFGTVGDRLARAIVYAEKHGLRDAPGVYKIARQVHTCPSCGGWFSGRNGAKTCSSRCRKRLQRKAEKMSHLITKE